jgi:hypothetical protein
VGILALDGLDDVRLAGPYVEAAFALLRGASGVVLDLRRDGGGDPGTVMLVLDWLLGASVHIADVIYRDRTRQWWTTGRLAERALPEECRWSCSSASARSPAARVWRTTSRAGAEGVSWGSAPAFSWRSPGDRSSPHLGPTRLGHRAGRSHSAQSAHAADEPARDCSGRRPGAQG